MSTVRDQVIAPLNKARAIIDQLGFRNYTVTVRTITWYGTNVGEGTPSNSDLVLSPNFKVRVVGQRDLASDVGTLRDGDLKIAPITPATVVVYGTPVQTGTGAGVLTASPVSPLPSVGISRQGDWSLVVLVTTNGATFQYSLDGGATYNGVDLTIAGSVTLASIQAVLGFSGAFTAGDTYAVHGSSVGYTPAQLRPATTADNVQTQYLLAGREGTLVCNWVREDFDRALRHSIYVRMVRG